VSVCQIVCVQDSFAVVLDVVEQVQLKQRLLACITAVFLEHLHDSIMLQDKCCLLLDAEYYLCSQQQPGG